MGQVRGARGTEIQLTHEGRQGTRRPTRSSAGPIPGFPFAPLRLCTALRQNHSFSRRFLTADFSDGTDGRQIQAGRSLSVSSVQSAVHPVLIAALPRCVLALIKDSDEDGRRREAEALQTFRTGVVAGDMELAPAFGVRPLQRRFLLRACSENPTAAAWGHAAYRNHGPLRSSGPVPSPGDFLNGPLTPNPKSEVRNPKQIRRTEARRIKTLAPGFSASRLGTWSLGHLRARTRH